MNSHGPDNVKCKMKFLVKLGLGIWCLMPLSNNISVILWQSVLLVEGTRRKPPTCHKSLTNFIT